MISAILLAAGRSQRMGRQKVLLPYGGVTVIEHIVDVVKRGGTDEIIVVTGHDAERAAPVLGLLPVQIVHNAAYDEGMLSSVRQGIRAAAPETMAYMIVLGDQPAIRPEVVAALITAFRERPEVSGPILVPTWKGCRGHPLLVHRRFREEMLHQHDDVGLRGLIAARANHVHDIPAPGSEILRDMDVPEDYAREIKLLEEVSSSQDKPGLSSG